MRLKSSTDFEKIKNAMQMVCRLHSIFYFSVGLAPVSALSPTF